jgi:hypothetical protein
VSALGACRDWANEAHARLAARGAPARVIPDE